MSEGRGLTIRIRFQDAQRIMKNALTPLIVSSVLCLNSIGCRQMDTGVTNIPTANNPIANSRDRIHPIGPSANHEERDVSNEKEFESFNVSPRREGIRTFALRADTGNYRENRGMFEAETFYFDYDYTTVNPSEMPKVETVASYLKKYSSALLRLEGHSDERGTAEYNRGLSERRVVSIREHLIALGIASFRISTLSFGEDKPAVIGQDETSWAKNRRGEFVILTPKN